MKRRKSLDHSYKCRHHSRSSKDQNVMLSFVFDDFLDFFLDRFNLLIVNSLCSDGFI